MIVKINIEPILKEILGAMETCSATIEPDYSSEIDSFDYKALWEALRESLKYSKRTIKWLVSFFIMDFLDCVIDTLNSYRTLFVNLIMAIHFHSDLVIIAHVNSWSRQKSACSVLLSNRILNHKTNGYK